MATKRAAKPGVPPERPGRVDKRRDLLDAALDLFLAHGVVETTLDDLLQRSGASVGSLYHHFGGKEELADALYVECLSGYHASARHALDATTSAEQGIRSIVEHHLAWTSIHPAEARYLIAYRDHEVRPASDNLRALNRGFYGYLESWLSSRTDITPRHLPVVVAQWIGPTHNFARHWLTGNTKVSPREATAFLSDSAWASLAPLFTGHVLPGGLLPPGLKVLSDPPPTSPTPPTRPPRVAPPRKASR